MLEIPDDWRNLAEGLDYPAAQKAISGFYERDKHILLQNVSFDLCLLLWHAGPSNFSSSLGKTVAEEERGEPWVTLEGYFRAPPRTQTEFGWDNRAYAVNLLAPKDWSNSIFEQLYVAHRRVLVDVAFSRRQELLLEGVGRDIRAAHLLRLQERLDQLSEGYRLAVHAASRKRP